mmetsp:Transcript_37340/g.33007  ORF Transcript_37340/g.33007 Transcript_37340/m.33007 type:complete len:400 (-) Transcript_37340:273-1472(-)
MSVSPLKRLFLEVSNEGSPIPYKKRKRQNLQSIAIQDAIQHYQQSFNADKLCFNRAYTIAAATKDPLFAQPAYNAMNPSAVRWVLACKFIIASQLRLDQYDCLGMHRNKIPQNMYFYVDQQNNLCCIINHDKNENNSMSQKIISHCNKIETSMIQSYVGNNDISKLIGDMITDNNDNDDEDDDLWLNTKQTKTNHHKHSIHHSENNNNNEIITIIRVPMVYYGRNIKTSFYELCCKIANHIITIKQDFSNPLFQILMQNIANFDCFQSSVPMIPLKGSIYQMFCQYGLGLYNHKDKGKKNTISKKEFIAILGAYDCWKQIEYKDECRKSLYRYWTKLTGTDVNILQIVNEYSDFDEMSVESIVDYISNFNQGSKYNSYLKELKTEIPNLNEIVAFKSKW